MNVAALLDDVDATATALVDCSDLDRGPRLVSFGQLRERVRAAAAVLRARGLQPGERVMVFVPMSVDLYVALLGVLHAGCTAVFADPWAGSPVLDRAARATGARGFVGIPKAHLLRLSSGGLRRIPLRFHIPPGGAAGAMCRAVGSRSLLAGTTDRLAAAVPRDADDVALITFTSGTTGTPRGAERTHGMLAAQDAALARDLSQRPGDIHLTNLPIVVLHNLSQGAAGVIPPATIAQDPHAPGAELAKVMDAAQVTVLTLSPTLLASLVGAVQDGTVSAEVAARIRHIHTGGGPVLPSLCADTARAFPAATLVVLYGSTEAEPIAQVSGAALAARAPEVRTGHGLPAGNPVEATRLVVVEATPGPIEPGEGAAVAGLALAPGRIGEILVAGDHVVRRYVDDAAAVREAKVVDADGTIWHRTGDAGYVDETGMVWLVGRVPDAVDVGARKVWPATLEAALEDQPGIARAALVEVDGTVVLAVEPAGAQAGDVLTRARAVIDAPEVAVARVDAIPVDPRHGAKVDRHALRAVLRPMLPLS